MSNDNNPINEDPEFGIIPEAGNTPVLSENEFDDPIPAPGEVPPETEEGAKDANKTEDASEKDESHETDDLRPPNNVVINAAVYLNESPYTLRGEAKDNFAITIVPKRADKLKETKGGWAADDNPEIEQFLARWLSGLSQQNSGAYIKKESDGENTSYNPGMFTRLIDDSEEQWLQGIPLSNGNLHTGRRPTLKVAKARRSIGGSLARDRGLRNMGVGISGRKPLPGTGVNIDLGPRSVQDYIDLDTLLTMDKVKYGRETGGITFENTQVIEVRRVWEFIKDSIRSINVQNWEDLDPGDYIRCTDLPVLYWAQVCTMYPDGYPLDLPCSAGPNICKHVERVLFDPNRALWVSGKRLARSQIEVLERETHPMSMVELKNYQENQVAPFTHTFTVNPGLDIVLEVPSINDYIASGEEWLSAINARVIELFGKDKSDSAEALEYINTSVTSAAIREYAYWVKELVYNKYDVVDGREDIAANLSDMSMSSKEETDAILAEIQRFIENSSVAIIAIPNFACPICEKDYVTDEFSKHPDLIPIDMLKHFFTVRDLRLTTPMTKSGS